MLNKRMMRKKRNIIKNAFFAILAIAGLASCSGEQFHIEGNITGAKDSILYFENMSLEGPVLVDSTKLTDDGHFMFDDKRPASPEFYRLRIAGQIINLSVDSTETISVKANYPTMATQYEIEGSDECKRIKELSLMQIDLQKTAIAINRNLSLSNEEARDSILSLIEAYKNGVKNNYIYTNPKGASSYFALFQTLGNLLIFNPRTNSDDIKAFAAVATSWDVFYHGTLRTENLHNIAIEGLKTDRIVQAENNKVIDPSKIVETNIIDISLSDNKGQTRSLTDLKGKVVMLDFHVFSINESPARILEMRELYNKYHAKGFEIYQISLDDDEHFWKQQTENLPWISVRDNNGLNSGILAAYNVRSIPEFFLIDRSNSLVSRSQQIKDIEKAIEKLL